MMLALVQWLSSTVRATSGTFDITLEMTLLESYTLNPGRFLHILDPCNPELYLLSE